MAAASYKAPKKRRWLKMASLLVIIFAVYGFGVAVGKGNVNFGVFKASKTAPGPLNYSSLDQIYNLLSKDHDGRLDKQKLLDGAKSGLVSATGDPYTEYFNPQDAKNFNNQLSGTFTGIGAELGTDDSNNIVVISPLSGFPAAAAGLKPHDVIAAVNGQSTSGMSVDAVVNKIRGPAGSKVTLTISRGSAPSFDVTITRAKITVPSVEHSISGQIGYLKVSQFAADTPSLAQQAAQDFQTKRVKGIILDLRDDPGGYLDGAVKISSLWLKQGMTVVTERRGNTTLDTQRAGGGDILGNLPTVVLLNEGSASASEITAGALRDNKAAQIVGVKSFGKGSVQEVEDLPDGSEVKITIARWYTPNGKNIDKQGITPDVAVGRSDADLKAGRDPQKDKATQILLSKIAGDSRF